MPYIHLWAPANIILVVNINTSASNNSYIVLSITILFEKQRFEDEFAIQSLPINGSMHLLQ